MSRKSAVGVGGRLREVCQSLHGGWSPCATIRRMRKSPTVVWGEHGVPRLDVRTNFCLDRHRNPRIPAGHFIKAADCRARSLG